MSYLPLVVPDKTSFTEGSSPVAPVGGVFNDSLAALSSGKTAQLRITEKRAAHVNLRREDGTEVGVAAAPLQVSLANTGANATPVATQDAADGATGAAAPAKAILAGGSDGANLRSLATDASGRQKVLLYDAAGNAITSTSSALDQNLKLIGGTAVDTNSGNTSAGTQRVVIASDQPALTTPLPVDVRETYSASVSHPAMVGNEIAQGSVAGTTAVTLVTGAPGYFITGFRLSYNQAALTSGVAEIVIVLADSVFGNVVVGLMMIPTATPTTFIDLPKIDSWPGFFWNNKSANSSLKASLNVNLTSGNVYVQVTYGLCSFVG